MPKPSLINVTKVNDMITQGTCPICKVTFLHGAEIGESSKDQVPNMYTAHLNEKHAGEDFSQAAARIVREATKE